MQDILGLPRLVPNQNCLEEEEQEQDAFVTHVQGAVSATHARVLTWSRLTCSSPGAHLEQARLLQGSESHESH